MLFPGLFDHLAVVPIFVNAGAALLPAIAAGIASVVALLLKPKELLAVCKKKPHIPLIIIGVIVGGYFLWPHLATLGAHPAAGPTTPASKTTATAPTMRSDWAKVALEIINNGGMVQQAAGANTYASGTASIISVGPGAAFLTGGNVPGGVTSAVLTARYFRWNAARTGHDGSPAPLQLKSAWNYNEELSMFLSSPVLANNRVYSATCYLDPSGASYGAVVCLDAKSGKLIWRTDVDGAEDLKGFFSSPAVSADGKKVIIGQGLHVDKDASLLCLNAATGKILWRVKTPLHLESSPVIDGDLVIIGAGAIEDAQTHKAIGNPGYVFAVNLTTGKEVWRYRINDPESSPVAADGIVYIGSGFNGHAIVALRTAPDADLKAQKLDRLLWKVDTKHPATGAVTLVDDMIIVGTGNGDYVYAAPNPEGIVYALNRKTGGILWSKQLSDAVLGAVAVADNRAICPGRGGEVVALDVKTGQQLWSQRISGDAPILAAPAVTKKHVYAVSKDGYLGILSVADGKIVERLYINAKDKPGNLGFCLSSPLIGNSRVYVGSETGGLSCFTGGKTE